MTANAKAKRKITTYTHKHCFHVVSFIGSISDDDSIKCANQISYFLRDVQRMMCCKCGAAMRAEGSKCLKD